MSQPNVDVRRRNSLPARLRRSSLSQKNPTGYRYRQQQMKSNPYIGWFRHSPDSSQSNHNWKKHQRGFECNILSSSTSCQLSASRRDLSKSKIIRPFHDSPYVGYFRHSPTNSLVDAYFKKMFKAMEDELFSLFKAFLPSLNVSCVQELADFLAGRLRGGNDYGPDSQNSSNNNHNSTILTNARIVSRLIGWIFAPLLGDDKDPEKDHFAFPFPLLLADINSLPSSPATTNNSPPKEALTTVFGGAQDDDAQESDGGRDDATAEEEADVEQQQSQDTQDRDISLYPLQDALPSLTETYYAQQAARELNPDEVIPSRLDFVITQMDIIRMQRNASRHLDVQSIYQLPSITYLKQKKTSFGKESSTSRNVTQKEEMSLNSQSNSMHDEAWSWMLVTEQDQAEGQKSNEIMLQDGSDETTIAAGNDGETFEEANEDVCVICLEHFVYGDRLRVLPCSHSFHMGCIDRWLSGSASFDNCHTAGCPMCKKRPNLAYDQQQILDGDDMQDRDTVYDEDEDELRPDGSVPSWAFSQLGSALLERDAQQLSYSVV